MKRGCPADPTGAGRLNAPFVKNPVIGLGPLAVTTTVLEGVALLPPLLEYTIAVLLIVPVALLFSVTLKLKLAAAPAGNASTANATASIVEKSEGAAVR